MVYRGLVSGGQFKLQESAILLKSKTKTKSKITLKERERSPFEFEFDFEFDFSTIFVINQLIMSKTSSDMVTNSDLISPTQMARYLIPFAALHRYT